MTRAFRMLVATVAVTLAPQLAAAQRAPAAPSDRFLRGVPRDTQPGPALPLSLPDAIRRGLQQNLGVLIEEQQLRSAEGRRWTDLSGLLPDVQAVVRESQQKVNLAAFGFTGFPGAPPDMPSVIGPFNVFDARVAVSQPVFDLSAIHTAREGAANLDAARHTYQDARNLVALVVTNLYLRELSDESRLEAARVELSTAETLYQLAVDQKNAGIVAGIDVLRADVERKAAAQRRILAENDVARSRLQLARAIGLSVGQEFTLTDRMSYTPLPALDSDAAIRRAMSAREDLRGAQLKVEAAEQALSAARGERMPSLQVQADYGGIGSSVGSAEDTYSVAANMRVPLFDRGRTKARVIESRAELAQRRAELADLQNGVSYDVQLALRDVTAAAEQVSVAESAVALASQALTQAQDRFRAGVASNIEVVQAQQAEAAARESHIASLYAHNLAKAALARALGVSEQDFTSFIGGQTAWQKP